jgi:thiol-disulfide isomerase/thioredoxin
MWCRSVIIASILGVSSVSAFQSTTHQKNHVAVSKAELMTTLFSSSSSESLQESVGADTNGIPRAAATKTTTRKKTGPIETLDSVADFLKYLDDAPQDSLCVVEFYGKNCPLCKRVALKYKKIANTYSKDGVRFAQMEHPANKPVMDVLGIRHFPFLHVYRNGQCVAAHGTESDTTFEGIVKDTIQRELDMTDVDWNNFLTAFAGHIQQGTARLDQLRYDDYIENNFV